MSVGSRSPGRRRSSIVNHELENLVNQTKVFIGQEPPPKIKSESENDCKEYINGRARVIPGDKILIREDTVVGCHQCNGKSMVGYSKMKFHPMLCWNRDIKHKNSSCVITTSAVIFLLCLIGSIILLFTDTFNSTILSNMVITNNTQAFELWSEPPVHPIVKVHVFNYTNAFAVMDGTEKKLRVQDIGPYYYEQTIKKVNIQFHPNGTVTYQNKRSFKLIPEKSVGAQFDKVIVPNLPMLTAISMTKESYFLARVSLSTLFTTLQTKLFRTLPIHRFLWGYEDELVSLAKNFVVNQNMPSFDKFGILITMNGTSRDVITINTGEKDMSKFAIIDRYNGYNKLPHWGTDECNRVDASDGSMFPPSMIDGKQKLYVYSEQACRRLPFVYEKDLEADNGIKVKRYSTPKNVFASPDVNPENQCFCHMDSGSCPPNGLFNSTPCAFGAPAFTSFPHFYNADPSLVDAIDGLEPTADKHAMFIDIHPTLGFPIYGVTRIQLNMQLRKSSGISGNGLDNFPNDLILPVVWLEFTVDELPPIIKSLIYHGVYSANAVRLILTCASVIGLIVSGIILGLATKNKMTHRRKSRRIPLPVVTTKDQF